MTTIEPEDPRQPDVVALIEALDAYQKPLYPPECHHGVDLSVLVRPDVVFLVARDAGGRAVGCGGVQLQEGAAGELKRMFVSPAVRGQGLARRLLARLEQEAAGRGCEAVRLETGIHQHAAIALYGCAGYERCGPFGGYADDPHSVFMRKRLAAALSAPPPGAAAQTQAHPRAGGDGVGTP